jgi:hypothetical protein
VPLKLRNVRELRFLEQNKIRDRGKQFRKDITTLNRIIQTSLNRIIQTSHIPGEHTDASIH